MLRKLAAPALASLSSAATHSLLSASTADRSIAPIHAPRLATTTGNTFHVQRIFVDCQNVSALCSSRRLYVQASRVMRENASSTTTTPPPPPPPSTPAGGASATETALDVAMRVNKLKKTHQSGGAGANKKEVEQEAWQALNSLTEDQINSAEGKAVSLLLNSWAYFAKFWARGKDGPI